MSTAGEGSSRGRGRGGGASGGGGGGGRRAAFGGSITSDPTDTTNPPPSSQRGGRSGGRGGGGSGGGGGGNSNSGRKGKQRANEHGRSGGATPSHTDPEAHSTSAQRAAESHAASAAAAVIRADAEAIKADPNAEYCFICAEPITYYSVAPCDHRTCHVCAIRLRALYKKMECTFCKTPSDQLIFTTSATKAFGHFLPTDIPFSDPKLNISFETEEAYEQTLVLLRFNCPHPKCEVASTGWSDLKTHARRDHGRLLCDLCIRFKKIFTHEHELHTSQSLHAHLTKDHGRCDYCKEYFYSDDELYVHMRDKHEQCHICKARGGEAERWTYYRDYDMLTTHFREVHYLCMNRECLEKRFVVFESEMDFKAHQLAEHANELSARERREALRVDAHFTFEDSSASSQQQYQSVPGAPPGAGQGRRGGRAGGPNRNERDVGGGGAASRRANFGGALTSDGAPPSFNEDEFTRQERIFNKAASILGASSESKIAALKSVATAYNGSECSSRDLVLTVFSLCGSDVDRAGALFSVLVGTGSESGNRGLFDEEEKRTDVLTSWNTIRMERTQFPSLSGSNATSATTVNSLSDSLARTQIRSIKKTAAASSNRVWENVERAATGSASSSASTQPGRYGMAAASGSRAVGASSSSASSYRSPTNFPALGVGAAPSNPGSVNVPGSARHAAAASALVRSGAAVRGGASAWGGSTAPSSNTNSGTSRPAPIVPISVHVSNGSSSSSRANLPSSAFPSLPKNSNAAALAAHKRALLSKGKMPVSPTTADGWASSLAAGSGSMSRGGGGSASSSGGPGTPVEGFGGEAGGILDGGAGGKKKKGKGVVLLSMGGVQRG
ncbi:hypothetical protein CF327_g148 [Tilletia walkeri]|nr:hypothetical protein CF327_g148 [Tilletia walkeri]